MEPALDFKDVLNLTLAKLVDAAQTDDAVKQLLDEFREKQRGIALAQVNRKLRLQMLEDAESQLIKDLEALGDTEQPEQPGQEQPGELLAGDGQEQPGPSASEQQQDKHPSKRKRK